MPAWIKLLLACLFALLIVLFGLAGMENPMSEQEKPIANTEKKPSLEQYDATLGQVIAPLLDSTELVYEDLLPDPLPETKHDAESDTTPAITPNAQVKNHPETSSSPPQARQDRSQQKLALVIDDVGYDLRALRRLLALPFTITVAILPDSPHAKAAAELAHQHGATVMLHMPMQTSNPKYQQRMERFYLHQDMTHAEFTNVFEAALAKIPYVQGVNNHMGSLLTSDTKAMQWLMDLCRKHHLFFLDSRTSSTSVAAKEAKAQALAWQKRDVFLDHKTDTASLTQAWDAALGCMQNKAQCVMIGHPHSETVAFLESVQNQLQPKVFVSIQAILK